MNTETYVRMTTENGPAYGRLNEDKVDILSAEPWNDNAKKIDSCVMKEEALLAPATPSKVVCLGVNYRDHASEMSHKLPEDPLIFMKAPTSVIGPNDSIVYPSYWTERVDYEAELALIIGKKAWQVKEEDAFDYIFGYTCLNDVTARDLQKKDGQWTRAKSFDTFCPLGPWIVTGIDPTDVRVSSRVNGEIRQESRTSYLIFSIPRIISFISHVMTLLPGDVIATGTPAGIGPLSPGDSVTIDIEKIGALTNRVEKR